MSNHLHIVSFDVPYPVDYGGVIDVYQKILAMKETGVKVHLHCFYYQRPPHQALEEVAWEVSYYQRNCSKRLHFNTLPFIVISRMNHELIRNLLKDEHPILFEGLHTCYHLSDPRLKGRMKMVRTHNVEHDYYKALSKAEKNKFKKNFFRLEARKLKKFEGILKHADHILAISPNDKAYFEKKFENVSLLPAFHNDRDINMNGRSGNFALYHGNLGVAENNEAALFLIKKVVKGTDIPLIIAGNKPSSLLKKEIEKAPNVELKTHVSKEEVDHLIREAQVNILPTFQNTGIKLKLLSALYKGKHCLVNSSMVENTGLEDLCTIRNGPRRMRKELKVLLKKPLSEEEIKKRVALLEKGFSNQRNAEKIKALLTPPHRSENHGSEWSLTGIPSGSSSHG